MTPRVVVVVDSRMGSTLALAQAMANGAASERAEVRLRRVGMTSPECGVDPGSKSYQACQQVYEQLTSASVEDLRWANSIAWGCPTRYGLPTTPMHSFIDEIGPLWRSGELIGKVGAAFTSTGGMHSGNETTLLNLLLPFLQHGMVIAGVPHSVPELTSTTKGGSPYGASAVTGFDGSRGVDGKELAIANALGARLARLAVYSLPEPASVETAARDGGVER